MGDGRGGCSEFLFFKVEQRRRRSDLQSWYACGSGATEEKKKAIKSQLKRYQWCSLLKQKPASCLRRGRTCILIYSYHPRWLLLSPFHSAFNQAEFGAWMSSESWVTLREERTSVAAVHVQFNLTVQRCFGLNVHTHTRTHTLLHPWKMSRPWTHKLHVLRWTG